MNQKPSFTAKPARDAEENNSLTTEDAKDAGGKLIERPQLKDAKTTPSGAWKKASELES